VRQINKEPNFSVAEKKRIYDNTADSNQDNNNKYEYATPSNNPQTYTHTTRHRFHTQDPLFASFQVYKCTFVLGRI
jgi:uncharacterized protein YgiB involved in biofilm formation